MVTNSVRGGPLTHYSLNDALSVSSFISTDTKKTAKGVARPPVRNLSNNPKFTLIEQDKEEEDDEEESPATI